MHHGTLLFSADLSALSDVLTPDAEKIAAKGIRSVKSRVVNLQTLLPPEHDGMTAETFKTYLESFFLQGGAEEKTFSAADEEKIQTLAKEKYETPEWLFGKFGTEEKNCRKRFDFGTVAVSLRTLGGKIGRIAFSGDFFGAEEIAALESALAGTDINPSALIKALEQANISRFILGAAPAEIAALILAASDVCSGTAPHG